MNITPEKISKLEPNEIFVFGSNLQGEHVGGAARFALMKFGAEMGNGVGIQGQSYAIPTLTEPAYKNLDELKLPLSEIQKYVDAFVKFAKQHQDLFFYVTPIGCGIAGFTEAEIAPLFSDCVGMENIALPQSFIVFYHNMAENKKLNKKIFEKRNMKQVIRLTEGDLHRIVENSVRRLMNEIGDTREGQYMLGKASKRADKNNSRRFDIGSNKFDDYARKRREEDKDHSDQMEDDFYDGYENYPFNRGKEHKPGKFANKTSNSKYGENYGKKNDKD